MERDWTPKRRGKIYCSPACGLGCTHAEFMTATRKAKALVKRLGAGWKPRVWENLGWHYEAVKGEPVRDIHDHLIEVIPHRGCGYTIYLQTNPQIVVEHKNPIRGVSKAMHQAQVIAYGLLAAHKAVDAR